MPDHLHLIILGKHDDSNVLRGVEDFKQLSGYWLASNFSEIKWQKSFHDRIIRAQEFADKVRYVLDNPVRAGFVLNWREFPFSGAIGLDLEVLLEELATQ
jgi:REP element-mobilizing transposase RayT